MRWKQKTIIPPKEGEKRFIKKFAWSPTLVDGYTIWLERYWECEIWCKYSSPYPGGHRAAWKHYFNYLPYYY